MGKSIWTPKYINPDVWIVGYDNGRELKNISGPSWWWSNNPTHSNAINDLPCVNGREANPGIEPTSDVNYCTFFSVLRLNDPTGPSQAIFALTSGATNSSSTSRFWVHKSGSGNDLYLGINWNESRIGNTSAQTTSNPTILSCFYRSDRAGFRQDGEEKQLLEGPHAPLTGVSRAFISNTGTWDLDAWLGEVIVVYGEVSDADIKRVEGYLSHKWGLVGDLPEGHPYKSCPPTPVKGFSGVVKNSEGNPVSRRVVAVTSTSEPEVVSTEFSDPEDGSFVLAAYEDVPHTIYAVDDEKNALIFDRVTPEILE